MKLKSNEKWNRALDLAAGQVLSRGKRSCCFSLRHLFDKYIHLFVLYGYNLEIIYTCVCVSCFLPYRTYPKSFLFLCRIKSWRIIHRQGLSGQIRVSSCKVWQEAAPVVTFAQQQTIWTRRVASRCIFELNVSKVYDYLFVCLLTRTLIFTNKYMRWLQVSW